MNQPPDRLRVVRSDGRSRLAPKPLPPAREFETPDEDDHEALKRVSNTRRVFAGGTKRILEGKHSGVLRLQPLPKKVIRCAGMMGDEPFTVIVRHWDPADTARCRLCPACHAHSDGTCLVIIRAMVSGEECPMYSRVGARRLKSLWPYCPPFAIET